MCIFPLSPSTQTINKQMGRLPHRSLTKTSGIVKLRLKRKFTSEDPDAIEKK